MQTITLKASSSFSSLINELVKEYKMTKSDLIRKAVIQYKDYLHKAKLRKKLEKASYLVRKSHEDFDGLVNDNLENV